VIFLQVEKVKYILTEIFEYIVRGRRGTGTNIIIMMIIIIITITTTVIILLLFTPGAF
jgi:hypothetical protein